jgi:nitrate reductase gamma subunit
VGGTIFILFYGSILFFFIAAAIRVRRCIRVPLHLHWELYRANSIYAAGDWWKSTANPFAHKLGSLLLDVIFLRDFYRRNRKFWYPLYVFHLGLYLLILWHVWLFVGSVVMDIERASSFGWVWGIFATGLTFLGGLAILFLRMTDEELKIYYTPIHYLKWGLVLLTLLGGIYAVDVHFGSSMPSLLKYVRDQATFSSLEHKLHPGFGPAFHIFTATLWLIYLPFSHVFDLFFRYYHFLKWDEVPNTKNSEIERQVGALLDRPVSWSARHIQTGKKWKEVATEEPPVLEK